MSVLKSKRQESTLEFIHTARQLQIHTIRKCIGFPKRYTFYVSQHMAECATNIYESVICANNIYPTNKHEFQMRTEYFLKADAQLHNLVAQIELANELFGIEADKMRFWMEIVEKEIRLVKGVMKRDKERFKDLE